MPEMPLLGQGRHRSRRRLARLAVALVIAAAAGLVAWRLVAARSAARERTAPASTPLAGPAPAVAAPPETPPPAPSADDVLRGAGMRYAQALVSGPLETAFVKVVGRPLGEQLTQVVTRTLVWWVSVPDDLRRGDTVDVLFSERQGAEPLVHAVRFRSEKHGRTFEAFRFQPTGSPFAHYYTRDGKELELRLRDAPLDDHEQVTSLLADGRGHKGIDFRTPVGSPVKATFDAVVARKTWNFRANGNCLELHEVGGAGRIVYFLHLSELPAEIHVGDRVSKGQVVARSGNTGHSFAPHLHYQLMTSGGALMDPFATEPTYRRALPDAERARFDEELRRLDGLIARAAEASAKGH